MLVLKWWVRLAVAIAYVVMVVVGTTVEPAVVDIVHFVDDIARDAASAAAAAAAAADRDKAFTRARWKITLPETPASTSSSVSRGASPRSRASARWSSSSDGEHRAIDYAHFPQGTFRYMLTAAVAEGHGSTVSDETQAAALAAIVSPDHPHVASTSPAVVFPPAIQHILK